MNFALNIDPNNLSVGDFEKALDYASSATGFRGCHSLLFRVDGKDVAYNISVTTYIDEVHVNITTKETMKGGEA